MEDEESIKSEKHYVKLRDDGDIDTYFDVL